MDHFENKREIKFEILKILELSDCENLSIYPENDILKGEEIASFLNKIRAQL